MGFNSGFKGLIDTVVKPLKYSDVMLSACVTATA